jgi:uncharacterized membrane protein
MSTSYVVSDSHWRSAFKGITYRVFATLVTTTVSFLMTGSVKAAAIIGSAEVTTKVMLYWVHERVWARITWGRHHKVTFAGGPSESPASPIDAPMATRGHAMQEAAPLPVRLEIGVQSPALDLEAS